MDKSDSELLEDWDVVSSVYDTEQENSTTANKTDTQTESSAVSDVDLNTSDDAKNANEDVKSSGDDDKETSDACIETSTDCDTIQTVEDDIVSKEINEVESAAVTTEADITSEQMTGIDNMEESSDVSEAEPITVVDVSEETKVCVITKESSPVSAFSAEISAAEADTETVEVNNQTAEESIVTDTHKVTEEIISDSEAKNNHASDEQNIEVPDHKFDDYRGVDNSDDHVANSSLDSSMEHIQIEHCEGSFIQDELLPGFTENENAAIESSSSDIDIIDENIEECVTSSFVHPLSLSISSSVDASSILTTPSESDKEVMREIKTEDSCTTEKTESHTESSPSYPETFESYSKKTSETFQKSKYGGRDEDVRPEPERPRRPNASHGIIFPGLAEFFRNMTRLEWSILGGLVFCLYITIVFDQTNIFAIVEKEDVASQMKKMIDELKYDNKILKDQMLREMKNEKVFSTFEHQIKELKKENYKLSHMLYDVAKVLEDQKDAQKKFEIREADYTAPFKKEINKLKEHINILKFDNEELQKQLVRMRYASYSQGGSDKKEDKTKEEKVETKSDETRADETASTEEISLDINTLKKWNELITLLSKELGLSENEPLKGEKSHSETKNIKWYWKVFLQEFKGTFKDFKENVTSVISDYKKRNEKAVSEIYKFVKDFFTVKEDNNQRFVPPGEESSQWKNIGDFVKDLREKWTKIKDRIYTSDIKDFIRSFKKSGEADASHNDYGSEKSRSNTYNYGERKPENAHYSSERKYDKATQQSNSEDSKWMFKRAELRAELRDSEKEDESVNWYLKRKKHTSQDDEEVKF